MSLGTGARPGREDKNARASSCAETDPCRWQARPREWMAGAGGLHRVDTEHHGFGRRSLTSWETHRDGRA